ncbi:16S rRNA methyltransferase [Kouleothrix aurantiaca]|jgi:16S rRNA (adenine1518-N6/adenine1519-N6)-dimethyltransferase|uniref:Ribosomal RNA small subunit methyltransferase A n=1 Tax=Kouleothrix aurantiaca TaxID=186479 RepID=A0A0P9FM13_9CHLR|nr:16S rRNA methyltransferase [Kouleothrix aurantiaca]
MTNPYIQPSRVHAALRALGVRPSRDMGQNFLVDSQALAAIVAAAELSPTDTVLEVGPGLGVLTWELLQQAGRVVSVELDRRLAERLAEELAAEPHFTLIQGDILRTPFSALLGEAEAYKVVANLPYQITSAALRHFLEAPHKPETIVVLVQWEVAERICAGPGDYSVLAHSVQLYAQPEIVARVPASSFIPAPAVDSAILRLHIHTSPRVDVAPEALMRLIKAGFLQARKKLGNALPTGLASLGVQVHKEQALTALASATIDSGRRAETLTLDEWVKLYRAFGFDTN